MTDKERIESHTERILAAAETAEGLPDAGTKEVWVFTMEDGTTVEKEVTVT